MKYSPCVIAGLFLDNADFNGLYYWYETIVEFNKPPDKKK